MAGGGKGGVQTMSSLPTQPVIARSPQAAAAGARAPTAYSTNPMGNAALGFQNAFRATQDALSRNGATQAYTYNPATYNPATYAAAMQAYQDPIHAGMAAYQNPYEDQVVQSTTRNMRDQLAALQEQNADAAIAAGAFGGGRHGVVEGITNAQGLLNIGDVTGQLRHQGFATAAGLAGQDIANRLQVAGANQAATNTARQFNADSTNQAGQFNANSRNQAGQFNALQRTQAGQNAFNNSLAAASTLGNLAQASYGVGRSINNDQMQAGAMTQQLMQQILGAGQQGYDQRANQAQQLLQMRLAALGMNPLNNATTSTETKQTNPGWGAMFGNLIGAAGNSLSFTPITLPFSSKRYKSNIEKTGKQRRSVSGKVVDEVTYTYTADPDQIQYVGVVAEDLGPDDPAVIVNAFGQPDAVDYSKLETV